MFKIVTFYEFTDMSRLGDLVAVRDELRSEIKVRRMKGTVILAKEGYNAAVAGLPNDVDEFTMRAGGILQAEIECMSSYSADIPFRRVDVKIKAEIVTLKKKIDISLGNGTHVSPQEWNKLLVDPDVLLLDARNDYEFRTGTFRGAINPSTSKFSDLPGFVEVHFPPAKYKKVAMFCTGGIRCEKFAPYLKEHGFDEVYQLQGGILKYLEEVDSEESLWEGECFVFDSRVSLDDDLKKGQLSDLSQPAGASSEVE